MRASSETNTVATTVTTVTATARDGASARRATMTTATTGTVDESKGLRLLRACGYRGRGGLGKREDGAVEPVRVRVKRDRRGVGDPRAETYEVVGEESETPPAPPAKTREDAKRQRTRADDADDADDAQRLRDDTQKMAHICARAEAKRRREKEVTRAMFRAFKSADVEADANPLLRALRVEGGMSRTNPLRRSRG